MLPLPGLHARTSAFGINFAPGDVHLPHRCLRRGPPPADRRQDLPLHQNIGLILHHSATSLVVCAISTHLWPLSRPMLAPCLLPVVQHWFALLKYEAFLLYTVTELALEVILQVEVKRASHISNDTASLVLFRLISLLLHQPSSSFSPLSPLSTRITPSPLLLDLASALTSLPYVPAPFQMSPLHFKRRSLPTLRRSRAISAPRSQTLAVPLR